MLQGQAEERNRIAREMHDVLAHRISLVSMHAGVLAYRDDLPPEQVREIAGVIQDNARQSMTELRAILPTLSTGMIPKMEACLHAVEGGVPLATIVDGRRPHSLLLEIFTDEGVGTMVTQESR